MTRSNHSFQNLLSIPFGRFNPTFFGVKTFFWEESNPPPIIQSVIDEPDPQRRLEAGRRILALPKEEILKFLSYFSAFDHECRHFHDFLLTPNGTRAFLIHGIITAHAMPVLNELLNSPSQVIPVPITAWGSFLNDEEHVRRFESVGLSRQALENIDQAVNWHAKFSKIMRGHQSTEFSSTISSSFSKLTPLSLYEASAMLTQFSSINRLFGAEHVRVFQDILFQNENFDIYTEVFKIFFEIWPDDLSELVLSNRIIHEVVAWSLLGNMHLDSDTAYPHWRFAKVIELLGSTSLPDDLRSTMENFDDWSTQIGVSRVEESLADARQVNQRMILQIQQFEHLNSEAGRRTIPVLPLMETMMDANELMVERFLNYPETYVFHGNYLEHVEDNFFIKAPHLFAHPGMFFPDGTVNLEDIIIDGLFSGSKVFNAQRTDGGISATLIMLAGPSYGVDVFDSKESVSWYKFFATVSRLLFSTLTIYSSDSLIDLEDHITEMLLREIFEEKGKTLYWLNI
jgi:hypothetical protein